MIIDGTDLNTDHEPHDHDKGLSFDMSVLLAGRRVLQLLGGGRLERCPCLAGCATTVHDDMHAGEAETSILLHVAPDLVSGDWADADWQAPTRPLLTLLGMHHYTPTGIIGTPSQATAEKGRLLLAALVDAIDGPLKLLRGDQPGRLHDSDT
jgi:creatinine amidohydrolase